MTVQANDRRKEYPGNGLAVDFWGPRAISAAHIKVYLEDTITKVSTLQTSGYTLTGVGKDKTKVSFLSAPLSTKTVIILNDIPYTQDCDISNQSRYLPEVLEESGLDPLEMQIQKLADRLARAMLGSDANSNANWDFDANNHKIINLKDGSNPKDAINLGQLLSTVEGAITNGPTYGVAPKMWAIPGDGVTTDFIISGADVYDPVMYDVVVTGLQKKPIDEYTIIQGADTTQTVLRFAAAPANLSVGFVILRGYSRPWSGPTPLTTLAMRIIDVAGTARTANRDDVFAVFNTTNAAATTITVKTNDGTGTDWKTGDYISATQVGAGQVTLALPAGAVIPGGMKAATRAIGCTISAYCRFADTNTWVVSGELAVGP